jgi:hypothetical protein
MAEFKGEEFEFPDEKEAKAAAQAEEKFEVEIEDDTPAKDRGRKAAPPPDDPTEDELSSYDEKVQSRIKKFTRGYHDERRAKEEAVRERQAAEDFARQVFEENKRLQYQLSSGSKVLIETSKSAAEIEMEAARKAYKDAYDAGDGEKLVDAQEKMTGARFKLERANGMRPIEVEEREYQPPQNAAPQQSVTPRAQKWADKNADWWGKDEEMSMAAVGIDKKLQREYGAGYVGTEEYYQTIDKTMRKRFPEYFEDTQSHEDDESPPQKRSSEPDEDETPRRARYANVVAPATRSTPPNRIKLKASEANIARRLGVPLELYAKQVAQLKRGI